MTSMIDWKNEFPEYKYKIGDLVFYNDIKNYGRIIAVNGETLSMETRDGNIYKVYSNQIYKLKKPRTFKWERKNV